MFMVSANTALLPWYVCSEQCADAFITQIAKHISPNDIDVNEEITEESVSPLVMRAITNEENEEWLNDENERDWKRIRNRILEGDWFNLRLSCGDLFWDKIERLALTIKAQNLMKVRRFEDAAKIYEYMRMYEKAGKTRAKDKEVRVKRVEVSVDLNNLLKQVKDGGVVVVYRCPLCRAPMKIGKDTSIDSLRVCEHCGSEIKAVDIADLLKTALS